MTTARPVMVHQPRLVAGLLTVAGAGLAAFVARSALHGRLLPLLGLCFLVGLMVCVEWPLVPAVALVALGATVFPLPLMPVTFAGVRSDVPELLAGGLVAGWLLRLALRKERPKGPYVAPVVLLVVGALVGAGWSAAHGVTRQALQGGLKPYLVYLVALVLSGCCATAARQRRLEQLFVAVCTVASVWVLVVVAVGGTVAAEAPTELYTLGSTLDVHRVRPPLLALLPLALLLVMARASRSGWTLPRAAQVIAFVVTILLGFNRSSWIPLALACVLFVVLRPGMRRPRVTAAAVLCTALAVPALYFGAANGLAGTTGVAVVERIASTVNPQVLSEGSYTDRADEDRAAIATLERSPVFGVGVAGLYGARRALYRPDLGYYVYVDRPFIHNSYLFAWLQTGLLGLGAIVLLVVRVRRTVRDALRRWPPAISARVLAAALALLASGLAAFFQPYLLNRPAIVATCFALALAQPPREEAE